VELLGARNDAPPYPKVKVAVDPTLPALSVGVTVSLWEPFPGSHASDAAPPVPADNRGLDTPSNVYANDAVSLAPVSVNTFDDGVSCRHCPFVKADAVIATAGFAVSVVKAVEAEYAFELRLPSLARTFTE
jgi:hypothetical protein